MTVQAVAPIRCSQLKRVDDVSSNTPKTDILDSFIRRMLEDNGPDATFDESISKIISADLKTVEKGKEKNVSTMTVKGYEFKISVFSTDPSCQKGVSVEIYSKSGSLKRRDLYALRHYEFALYKHPGVGEQEGKITLRQGFKLGSTGDFAGANLFIDECTQTVDPIDIDDSVIKGYKINPDEPESYSIIVFKDGKLIVPI